MPKLKDMFKKTGYISIGKTEEPTEKPQVPEGLWVKCPKCGAALYREDVVENSYVCPKCGGYFRIKTKTRIRMVADRGSFEEWETDVEDRNPLDFPGYGEKLEELRQKTHLKEAVTIGKARIDGQEAVLGVCDARFLMSSMGYVVGEKITRAVERATALRLPVILFCCSGGARMQEGIVSLMQMAKTSAALKRHSDAGLLYIPVLTDPTTGGVTASFAMLGDIILAEPGALIGFAGPRVIAQTIGEKLPEGFQKSEFLLEKGMIDAIVERRELKKTLSSLIKMHGKDMGYESYAAKKDRAVPCSMAEDGTGYPCSAAGDSTGYPGSAAGDSRGYPCSAAENGTGYPGSAAEDGTGYPGSMAENDARDQDGVTLRDQAEAFCAAGEERIQKSKERLTAWDRVETARMAERPSSLEYINSVFEDFIELHGDRGFRDDGAVVGGIAWFNGQPVTVIGQQKGRSTKENITRNFGMVSPEGYRKALRLMRQAEKFKRPIICFVDTPGAACGIGAEERGQGEAIARNLMEMSSLKTPVLSIVIGEGGSGGALGMAVANEVWMMEHATYSILSPEGFASILWKDGKRAREASEVMKITAEDLKELGIIEEIIKEEIPACQDTIQEIAADMGRKIGRFLESSSGFSGEELAAARYERFRRM